MVRRDPALWYRFWSAAFGVGCVLITFALGTLLFRTEVGFLAGLFLTFNRDFLFCHGIRFGGMDAMLAFFITAVISCYAWLQKRPARARPVWGLLGLCMGLAWLSKPPVFGCFFLTFLLLHHLWTRRREPFAARVAGPSLALAIGIGIAAPWYLLMWLRLGNPCLQALFVYNSVERALDSSVRDIFCCHREIWRASNGFKLVEPALACAFCCWLFKHRRPQWGLLLLPASTFLVALSAAGKSGCHHWYLFYAFPLLSVLLAGLFLESAPCLAARFWPGPRARVVSLLGVGLATVLVGADAVKTLRTLATLGWVHPPVGIYERLAAELEQGRCHFVLFDFPSPCGTSPPGRYVAYEDIYYCQRMQWADRVGRVEELASLLQDQKPAVVLLPSLNCPTPAAQALAGLRPEIQIEENPVRYYTYPVLTFHGAAANLTPAELVRLSRGSKP